MPSKRARAPAKATTQTAKKPRATLKVTLKKPSASKSQPTRKSKRAKKESSSEAESTEDEDTSEDEDSSSGEDDEDDSSSEDEDTSEDDESEDTESEEDEDVGDTSAAAATDKKTTRIRLSVRPAGTADASGASPTRRSGRSRRAPVQLTPSDPPSRTKITLIAQPPPPQQNDKVLKTLIGRRFQRRFSMLGVFTGTIVGYTKSTKTEELVFHVKYADGDEEDLGVAELERLGIDVPLSLSDALVRQKEANDKAIYEAGWPNIDFPTECYGPGTKRVHPDLMGIVVGCWRFCHRFKKALKLAPFRLCQLEEALCATKHVASDRLITDLFQSLLTVLLSEEVEQEVDTLEELGYSEVPNPQTHMRGGVYATRLDLLNDCTWLEILRQTVTEGESLNLPTVWSAMSGCQEVLQNMLDHEEEITDGRFFSTPMDADVYEDFEVRVPNPLDLRQIESRLNSGWYTEAAGSTTALELPKLEVHGDKETPNAPTDEELGKGGGPASFARDMRTIWANHMLVEEPTAEAHTAAKDMSEEFERVFKQYVTEPFGLSLEIESGEDDSDDESDDEEEYEEEWLNLRRSAIAAASKTFYELDMKLKVELLKWLCDEVMESDAVREAMDDMQEEYKDSRKDREKKRRELISRRKEARTAGGTALIRHEYPVPKQWDEMTEEEKKQRQNRQAIEGPRTVGARFSYTIRGYGELPGLVIGFTPGNYVKRVEPTFRVRYNDGTIDDVTPADLQNYGVPFSRMIFGLLDDAKKIAEPGRGRGRPKKGVEFLPETLSPFEEIAEAQLSKAAENIVALKKKFRDEPYGCDRRGNRYWHFGSSDGLGRLFIENGITGEWRSVENLATFNELKSFLNRRNKMEKHLLQELELLSPCLTSIWADRAKSPMVTVDPRRNQSSPPVFFDCKLFPRPYSLEITSSGVIENVEPGVALVAGVRRGDSVVRIGQGPAQWSDFVARDGVGSSLVVSNIVSMPEEATWIKFARGRNYRSINANGTVEVEYHASKSLYPWYFPHDRDCMPDSSLSFETGGKVLTYAPKVEDIFCKVPEFALCPNDYVCEINGEEVFAETTEEEIFNMLRKALATPDPPPGGCDEPTAPMLHLTVARNPTPSSPSETVLDPYTPRPKEPILNEPAPEVLWAIFSSESAASTGLSFEDVLLQVSGPVVLNVEPGSASARFGIQVGDQVVQVGRRDISAYTRGAGIFDYMAQERRKSPYNCVVLTFARPTSDEQRSKPQLLRQLVATATSNRYIPPSFEYLNSSIDSAEVEKRRKYLMDVPLSTLDSSSAARHWLRTLITDINNTIIAHLDDVVHENILQRMPSSYADAPDSAALAHYKATLALVHSALAPAMITSRLKPGIDSTRDTVVQDWIRTFRNTSGVEIQSALSFGQLVFVVEKIKRASTCFNLLTPDILLKKIGMEDRVWMPEVHSHVIYSAWAHNEPKAHELRDAADIVSLTPLRGAYEVEVLEKEIYVSKINGNFWWKVKLIPRSLKFKGRRRKAGAKKPGPKPIKLSRLEKTLLDLLKRINRHPDAEPFKELVDVDVIADYFEYVKEPMYLKLIEKKIKKHEYRTSYRFMADVKQIVINCRTYCHGVNLYHDIPPAAERVYLHARQEMDALRAMGTLPHPHVENVIETMVARLAGEKEVTELDDLDDDVAQATTTSATNEAAGEETDLKEHEYMGMGPEPEAGKPYRRWEKIRVATKGGSTVFANFDTVTTEIQLANGVVFQSPTHFISEIRSKKNSPNQDIHFVTTGESLGAARDRAAVAGVRSANKRNPYGRGNLSLEKGPKPTRGRKLALLAELSCKIGDNDDKMIVVMNTVTGMILLDGRIGGRTCTPGEYCAQNNAKYKNPNRSFKVIATSESLANAKDRGACLEIEGEGMKDYPEEGTDIKGPKPAHGRHLRLFEIVHAVSAETDERVEGTMNTETSMITRKDGVLCTPKEFCEFVGTAKKNPNRLIKITRSNEKLRPARARGAIAKLDGEHDSDFEEENIISETRNYNKGPRPSSGARLDKNVDCYAMLSNGGKLAASLNTDTSLITTAEGEEMTPHAFCEANKSATVNPNKDIIIVKSKETLGKARGRRACCRIEEEEKHNYPEAVAVEDQEEELLVLTGKPMEITETIYAVPAASPDVKVYAKIDTRTSVVTREDGTTCTPAEFVSYVKTANGNANADVWFESTGEHLAVARKRNACAHLSSEDDIHYVLVDSEGKTSMSAVPVNAKGKLIKRSKKFHGIIAVEEIIPYDGPLVKWENAQDLWSQRGPKPTSGKFMPAGAVVYTFAKTTQERITAVINSWSNMVWDKEGNNCTPRAWVEQVGTESNDPEVDIIVEYTGETLGKAHRRKCIATSTDQAVGDLLDLNTFSYVKAKPVKTATVQYSDHSSNRNQGTCELCGRTNLGALGTHRRFCTGLKIQDPEVIVQSLMSEMLSRTCNSVELALSAENLTTDDLANNNFPTHGARLARFSEVYGIEKATNVKFYATLDIQTTKVYHEGDVFSPTEFVRCVTTFNKWPNTDIMIVETGESLGDARNRRACGASSKGHSRSTRAKKTAERSRSGRLSRPTRRTASSENDSGSDSDVPQVVSIGQTSLRRRKSAVTYNEKELERRTERDIASKEKNAKQDDDLYKGQPATRNQGTCPQCGKKNLGAIGTHLRFCTGVWEGSDKETQPADESEDPRAETFGIPTEQLYRSFAKNGLVVFVPVQSTADAPPCLFNVVKYKQERMALDEAARAQDMANDAYLKEHPPPRQKPGPKPRGYRPPEGPSRGRGRPRIYHEKYELKDKLALQNHGNASSFLDVEQSKYAARVLKEKLKAEKRLDAEAKRQKRMETVQMTRLQREAEKREQAKSREMNKKQRWVMDKSDKEREEQLMREESQRLKKCETSLEYLICEVEELDWETRVPQCTPDKPYYSSLRFFVNCLMSSRIVNHPKTQAMFAYKSLGKQWLDNYMDRIDASPDVLTKAAACQVLYYDGLRFRDELKSVASVLPALRQLTIDALADLQVKLGSLENWRQYQDEICKTGKSITFANHAPRENFSYVIFTKPIDRFVKRIKQFYLTVGKQPEFVPKHRTEAGRDSLRKVWALRTMAGLGLDVKDRAILKERHPVKRKEPPVGKRKRPETPDPAANNSGNEALGPNRVVFVQLKGDIAGKQLTNEGSKRARSVKVKLDGWKHK